MQEQDIYEALDRVREHFTAREVNVNTVLAAYLRAAGLEVGGAHWQTAKAALGAGATFEEAVKAAAPGEEEVPPSAAPPSGGDGSIPSGPDWEVAAPMGSLEWFPKQFGPGDIDGVGAKRLLGTPTMANAAVLVRETGQNSWDARGRSPEIEFTLNLRRLDRPTVELLRRSVFTGACTRTGLPELLQRDEVWALEVSDRGTVGLGGPVRNDLAVPPSADTNFIDLVLNIGAPRDVHLGGGTYGFGKTIAYSVSSVGSTLIWSRCATTDGLEHRLIGSAIGEGFDADGLRYTGRHWWGRVVPEQDRVEPQVGDQAESTAEAIYTRHFDASETGTSILILDPQLGGESREGDVRQLVEAVTWHLWPKMLTDQHGRARMNIRVQLDGVDVPVPSIERHPLLAGHAACLYAVRAAQEGRDISDHDTPLPISLYEIWCHLPKKLLGHLALTRFPVPRGAMFTVPDGIDAPSRHVTLMRHGAELVVKYLERSPLDVDGFQWAGVFKPVDAVDDSFAMAEPPAHDDWIPGGISDKPKARDVRVALKRINETVTAFLSPASADSSSGAPAPSAAVVGDRLADLVAGIEGPAPTHLRKSTTAGGKRVARPRVDIVAAESSPSPDFGWTRTVVDLRLGDSGARGAVVEVRLRVGVDGGSEDGAEVIRPLGWISPSKEHSEDLAARRIDVNQTARFEFEARSDIAVDVDAVVVEG